MIRRALALALILGLGACQLTVKIGPPDIQKEEAIDTTASHAYDTLPMKPPCNEKPCDI